MVVDEIQCSHCKFVTDPASAAVNGNACPNCQRPYAHQPTPTNSEMQLRDMPGAAASGMDDMGGNPLMEGILADNGWRNPMKRDESFASVRTAEFMLPGQQEQAPAVDFNTAYPTHKFIVTGDGSVFDGPEPTEHENIAQHLGDTEAHLRSGALGQLFSNGTTNWVSNATRLNPEELQQALQSHYGYPVKVDPSHPALSVRTPEERFGLGDLGHGRRELDILNGPALPRPYGRPPIPGEKEWQLRGGKVAMEPSVQIPAETTEIALPGHTTENVTPTQYGLHGDVLGALNDIGAYVNGRQVSYQHEPEYTDYLKTHFSGSNPPAPGEPWGWPENQGQPIMLSHPDPEMFQLAKQVVERGSRAPLLDYARNKEAGHPLTLQTPKGITDNLHLALGNLRSWVENPKDNGQLRPYYNDYHPVIRPLLQNRQAINVGVGEPLHGEILNHVAQTDDLTPLYEYRGLKQSHVKTAGPLALAAPEALGALGEGAAAGAGAGAGAEAAGGGGGLLGGVGGLMRGALGSGMPGRFLQFEGLHHLLGQGEQAVGGGAGGGGAEQAGFAGSPAPVQDAGYYARTADYETPSSHGEIPKNDDGDSNQKDDGDNHEWQKDYDVNGTGGTDTPSMDFDPHGPGIERMMSLLPLILKYFNSEESGAHDPMLQGLDQTLEGEVPGYKDHGDPDAAEQMIMMIMPKGPSGDDGGDNMVGNDDGSPNPVQQDKGNLEKETRVDFLPYLPTLEPSKYAFAPGPTGVPGLNPMLNDAPPAPIGNPNSPTMKGHCPHCGALTDPANATCPQCGAALNQMPLHSPMIAKQAADHQGPHTPEQISAVQQLLIDTGRVDEVPDVPLFPQNYAEELAQIAQTDNPPDDSLGGGPPQPAQEEAPPEDTMPVPGMSAPQQMASAVARYASDSVAHACPKCGSHTTEVVDKEGNSHCHACGNDFKSDVTYSDALSNVARVALDHQDTHPNFQGVPAAEQHTQRDVSQEQDSSHHWKDSNGQPLAVGSEYEMYSAKFDIPDLIRIDSVKPDEIEYTLTGEYGLEHATTLSYQEAQIEQNNFVPTDGSQGEIGPGDNIETNNDDNTNFQGANETDDLSRPHALVAASGGTDREWLKASNSPAPVTESADAPVGSTDREWLREGGAKFTPWEQRGFIDESGVARNADKLDLSGTHYEAAADDDSFLFGL